MMLKKSFRAEILVLLFIGAPLSAAECPEQETWLKCWQDRLNENQTAQLKAEEAVEEREDNAAGLQDSADNLVTKLATQALVGGASTTEANLEDFLYPFLANLDIDGLDATEGNLRFKKNFQQVYGTLAVDAQAKRSELFPQLKMKFEEMELSDLIEDSEDEIGDFDDLSLDIMFSFDRDGEDQKTWWGRRYRDSSGVLTGNGRYATKAFGTITAALEEKRQQLLTASNDFLNAINGAAGAKPSASSVAERQKINASLNRLIELEQLDFKAFEAAMTQEYSKFGKLVANQPQFIITVGYQDRDELVGRDGWKVSTKYERGWANVNALREECEGKDEGLAFQTCYEEFMDAKKTALKHSWRLSFEGTYTFTDDYQYTSADGAVSLDLEDSDAWDIKASFGCTLRLTGDLEQTRFDLEAMYEDVSDDMKQSRFVATATFTERINDEMSLAAGIVYANRPEFRGDVFEEFSARAGLKLKLGKPGGSSDSSSSDD